MKRTALIKQILSEVVNPPPVSVQIDQTFIIWNTIHGEEQMCCRPTCHKNSNYRGCYGPHEDSTPITENEAIRTIRRNDYQIANSIAFNRFKPIFNHDPNQKMVRISANLGKENRNTIYMLLSLVTEQYPNDIISPFQFTLRIETARRSFLDFVSKDTLILNERYVNHNERTKILTQFTKTINTNFDIKLTDVAKNKIIDMGLILNDKHVQSEMEFYDYIAPKLNNILSRFNETMPINHYIDAENELAIYYKITRDSLRSTISNTGKVNIPTRAWNLYNFNILDIKASYH